MFKFYIQDLKNFSLTYENAYNFFIENCATLDNLKDNSLIFVKKKPTPELLTKFEKLNHCLIILMPADSNETYDKIKISNMLIETENPRLEFAKVFQFILDNSQTQIETPAVIGKNFQRGQNVVIGNGVTIGDNVKIDCNVVIGDNVSIANNCWIMSGAVIKNNVTIGEHSIIRENAVIGGWGYGLERDENGIPIRLPHIGGVQIGHDVEVGALTTVASGTFKPTFIGDYTKIDDHVHVSHNCHVGAACFLIAGATICGSVKIGDKCWIGPNCTIHQSIKVGNDATVGMGSVVKKDVPDGVIVSDNPAQTLEELALQRKIYRQLKKNFKGGYTNG